jgi:hypothetical protein
MPPPFESQDTDHTGCEIDFTANLDWSTLTPLDWTQRQCSYIYVFQVIDMFVHRSDRRRTCRHRRYKLRLPLFGADCRHSAVAIDAARRSERRQRQKSIAENDRRNNRIDHLPTRVLES